MTSSTLETTIGARLHAQWRAIFALLVRDWKVRTGRSPLMVAWVIGEPVVHMMFFVMFASFVLRRPPIGTSFALFFATGILPFFLLKRVVLGVMAASSQSTNLLPLGIFKPLDFFVCRVLVELMIWVVSVALSIIIIAWYQELPVVNDYGKMMAAIVSIVMFGLGWGLVSLYISLYAQTWSIVNNFLFRLVYFTGGIFYLPYHLPAFLQSIASYNPLLHFIELFRVGVYFGYGGVYLDLGYALTWSAVPLCLGLLLAPTIIRKVMQP